MGFPPHKTKIVATIGPASESRVVLERMLRAGMNVARLNFSHGDFATHERVLGNLRIASGTTGVRVTTMADLAGPKMRVGEVEGGMTVLRSGDRFTLTTEEVTGDQSRVSVSFARLPQAVKPGDLVSLNDGYIQLSVVRVSGREVECTVVVGGELRSRKGLNLPGIDLGIGAFTDRDRECLRFALEHGMDAVSVSFVESANDMRAVRRTAEELGHAPFLIAKIERARALERLDEIIEEADGVMIARGDLGVEVPIERIALVQKDIVRRANRLAKPVITATQMLESMTTHRLPTRAEATDVANAILDATDCVMLSGESAVGAYPVESVEMLAKIAATVEPAVPRTSVAELAESLAEAGGVRPEHLVAAAVEATLRYAKPAAVFTPTRSGASARRVSALRLPVWTVAVSPSEKTCQHLQFSYGVFAVHAPEDPESWNAYIERTLRRYGIPGRTALLTNGPSAKHPDTNHRLEIVELSRTGSMR